MSGYVYLLRMDDTDYYKVGVSAGDPNTRVATLQIGNPIELHLIAASEQEKPYQVEADIHMALEEYQVRGEWFRVERDVVIRIYSDYITMASIDTAMLDPVSTDDHENRKEEQRQRIEDRAARIESRRRNRIELREVLRAMVADGKGRDHARQWARDNNFRFDNRLWTEVRRELGLL